MSLLGKALGKLAGGAVSKLTGGLIKPKINFSPTSARPMIAPQFAPDSTVTRSWSAPGFSGSTSKTYFGKSQAGMASGGSNQMVVGSHCAPVWTGTRFKAVRMNKSTYITRGGGTSRWPGQLIVHPKGTECVTVRRRNVANGRALIHALSRVRGFVKVYAKAARALGHGRHKSCSCGGRKK